MNTKPYLSKTLWINLVIAAGALFFPPAVQVVQSHPTEIMVGWSMLNMVLRLVTKGSISLTD